jgi:hypothetical protein
MNKLNEGVPPSDNNKYDKVILIQALKEEVDELKETIDHMYSQEEMDERSCEIIRLEGDYEELREKNRGLHDDRMGFYNLFMDEIKKADALIPDGFSNHLEVCYDAIEKLKKENEELKGIIKFI